MAAAELWKEHYALQFLVLPGEKKKQLLVLVTQTRMQELSEDLCPHGVQQRVLVIREAENRAGMCLASWFEQIGRAPGGRMAKTCPTDPGSRSRFCKNRFFSHASSKAAVSEMDHFWCVGCLQM